MFLSKRGKMGTANVLAELEEQCRLRLEQDKAVYNLSAGTPDFPPDQHVMEALATAAQEPENYRYAISDFPALAQAAVQWYQRRFGVLLKETQVASVYGTQEGMAHIFFPLTQPGDIVLVPDPGYPVFATGVEMAGAIPYAMPLLEENDYLIDFNSIPEDIREKAKVMVVSYPNNPVAATAPPEFYHRLVAFAKEHNIFVIHDNAYCELVLDGKPGGSFLAVPGAMEIGVEFNSLSKSYNLTGMRLSFVLGNEEVVSAFRKFRSRIDYGPFPAVQKAAIAALTGPQDILEQNRQKYRERRDILCDSLAAIGWQVPRCNSTMFLWAPLPFGFTDDVSFTLQLLEKTGVVCVPGSSFGKYGQGYVRFALVLPPKELKKAVVAMEQSGFLLQ